MRICVVGERGYIGSNLVPYLQSKGHEVGNKFPDEIECIVNCAQYGSKPVQHNLRKMIQSNTVLPMQICDFKYKRMIHLASSSEIFQPETLYSKTKSLATAYIRGKATVVYIYTAWGGINQHEHTFMAALLKAKRDNGVLNITTPYATRDYVHIKHICRGIEELIDKPIGDYHFGIGKARRMIDIADLAKVDYTSPYGNFIQWDWKAANQYFSDTFGEDLRGELCAL